MQLVRIEAPNGIGMFINDDYKSLGSLCYDALSRHRLFNVPSADGLNLMLYGYKWFCGYKTIEQLKEWLRADEIKTLLNNEYNIFLIDAKQFQIGYHQIIYTKESIVSKININNLFQ